MSNGIATAHRKVAIICSHGGLDEAYPSLILANAARQSGIDASKGLSWVEVSFMDVSPAWRDCPLLANAQYAGCQWRTSTTHVT